ncbi:MAG TPA: NADP-dependent oxidoreductase [Bryobacteraceae bacterium]|nr:NADP-dependent oxidoreductase [Bryobacteraceae bacterium]
MKAIRFHEYGGPEVLRYEDAPKPEAGPGEALVRVHAAGINPLDWKIRAGYLQAMRPYPLPLILGWDLSGVVEANGPGAARFHPGDEVYSRPDIGRSGAYAEYIAVREEELAAKPKTLDHVHAAAAPLAALTAWQALFEHGGLAAGQSILLHAAAGGVGSFAVQFAHWKGARVIGTASARHHEYLKGLGCDQAIDYTSTRFEDAVRDVDIVLDTQAGETRARSWQVIRKGGILVSILGPAPAPEEAAAHGVRSALFLVRADAAQLMEIAALIDSGQFKVHLEAVFPLAEAARAHELSAGNHVRGKVVLKVL